MRHPRTALGRAIREARQNHGFSQEDLAARLSDRLGHLVSGAAVSFWERGTRTPRIQYAMALGHELGLLPTLSRFLPAIRQITTGAPTKQLRQIETDLRRAASSLMVICEWLHAARTPATNGSSHVQSIRSR